jgi:nucleotide-binding universal stress UspA family protein
MTVFVAYTSTPEGRRALLEGADWARQHGAALRVAHLISHEVGGESPTRARGDMRASFDTEDHLDRLRRDLTEEGLEVTTLTLHSLEQDRSRTLLDAAREAGAQLIVVGVRRRSRVGKLVLGSVAQDLLLRADCPVLAVKAPQAEV